MAAPKILNIDEYVPAGTAEQRVLSVKGREHPILEMTIENFLVTTKEARRLEQSSAPVDEQIEATIEMIRRYVPTLAREDLIGYSLPKLSVMVAFVRGDDLEQAAQAAETAAKAVEAAGENNQEAPGNA
jgi:hypothetical protein